MTSYDRFETVATACTAITWHSGRTWNTNHESATETFRPDAPLVEVDTLVKSLKAVKGAFKVEVAPSTGGRIDDANWSGHVRIVVRGTARFLTEAKNQIAFSGLREVDANADHDHESCLAAARKAGVPAWAAHQIETYLSA